MRGLTGRSRAAVLLSAVVLVGALAGAASGSAGDPVLAGKSNTSGRKATTLTSASGAKTFSVANAGSGDGLWASAENKNALGASVLNTATGHGGGAAILANSTANNGVIGLTGNDASVGVAGLNFAGGTFGGIGVEGVGGAGVLGIGSSAITGTPYGVYGGTSLGVGSFGVSGDPVGVGVYGVNSSTGMGGLFVGGAGQALYVAGDMTVTGAKVGFVADYAVNGSTTTLHQGDAVTAIGVRAPMVGSIPLIVVGPAAAGDPVIGLVDRAMKPSTLSLPAARPEPVLTSVRIPATPSLELTTFRAVGTDVAPGAYLDVVTLGAFSYASVSAAAGPIRPGDRLTPGSEAGTLVVAQPITAGGQSFYAPGSSVGYALGRLNDGTGRIAVFVSPQ